MRVAGRLAASVLEMIGDHVAPGITTEDLDRRCHEFIVNDLASASRPAQLLATPPASRRFRSRSARP